MDVPINEDLPLFFGETASYAPCDVGPWGPFDFARFFFLAMYPL